MNRSQKALVLALALVAAPALPAAAALYVVNTDADSGAGSLREAITSANVTVGSDSVAFNIPGAGPHLIALQTPLPTITQPLAITGFLESIGGAPGIELDGSALASGDGLDFSGSSTGSSVQYLSITGFPGHGIEIGTASVQVTSCYVGVSPSGTTPGANGTGIRVAAASASIGINGSGNVISGNDGDGIVVGVPGGFATIRGNRIGTNALGTSALPNGGDGIEVGGAAGVSIGGNTAGDGNVISGNGGSGVVLSASSSFGGVQGNLIGLDAAGDAAIGNGGAGIWLNGDDWLIGSTDPAGRNVIAGNLGGQGIMLFTGADDDSIHGNYIGTNAAGDAAIAGQTYGIRATGTVTGLTIGGSTAAHRNVISGASGWGISMESEVSGSAILGNYIGLNAAGTAAIPNDTGVSFGGTGNVLGGDTAGERNVVSGNAGYGIYLGGTSNAVLGNYVGTNPAGSAAIPNAFGIRVAGATGGAIGGAAAGEGNVISGNLGDAIEFLDGTTGVTVAGNRIGTDPAGTAAIANEGGIDVRGTGHTIGGASAADRNIISGNTFGGLAVHGDDHLVRNNYVGTGVTGTTALPNGSHGVRVLDAANATIQENLVSGNEGRGIVLDGASEGASIVGNRVGVAATGAAALPNLYEGILASGFAHTIGGVTVAERNLVSGNGGDGIAVSGLQSAVLGNYVGTDATGMVVLPNGGSGVELRGSGHLVGGSVAGARNVISGNDGVGMYLQGSDHDVSGNYIGVSANGALPVGNGSYGIRADTAVNCMIGGFQASEGNVIAANGRGVNLGYGSHDVLILNNILGLDAAATTDITAGGGSGIEIRDSWDNTVGLPGDGNVIAGFQYQGIEIDGADSHGNTIQGNWIGTNKSLANGLGNGFAGIFVTDASENLIGGTGAGEGNVIANNYQFGVRVDRGDRIEISGNSIWGNFFGIDIDEIGFFPNDGGDGDDGGNQTQNYPLLASALIDGGATDVEGMLINEPNTEYRVEFFSGPTCLPVGFGDGRTYRGSTQVTTGGGGQAPFAYAIPQAIGDAFLTATVTDPLGNTSEFSPCVAIDQGEQPGVFQFDRGAYVGYEGVLPTTQVFVTRSLGLSGTVTVDFATSDSSALAGSDYEDSDQTLTFEPWEVVKIVEVPILFDPAPEPVPAPEKLLLALSSPSGGATLGAEADSEIQVWDNSPADPGLTVSDVHVQEGDGGATTMTFEVHLSPSDHPVTVTYLLEPGTATPDVDYVVDSDLVSFAASGAPQTEIVEVEITGDTDVEADEIVWLRITSAPSGGNWIAYDVYGRGEIRNDDFSGPPPSNVIFCDGFETGNSMLWSSTTP